MALPLLRRLSTTASSSAALSPASRYASLIGAGALRPDAAQERAVNALTLVYASLSLSESPSTRGLYLYSGPGRGKTALVQLLSHPLVTHTHAHQFFRDLHARFAAARGDLGAVALQIAAGGTRVLALDELEVVDIADALTLARVVSALRARGVALLATSNRAPEALYAGGLNAELFQPAFGRTIRDSCDVLCLDGDGEDYRKARVPLQTASSASGAGAVAAAVADAMPPLLVSPAHQADAVWRALCGIAPVLQRRVAVPFAGRYIDAPAACARSARFSFASLCGGNASAACYSALAAEFDVVMLDGVPDLANAGEDALRRLVLLVDVLYARRAVLVLAAAEHSQWTDVSGLFAGVGGSSVAAAPTPALRVLGVGGSSGRLTTMVSPTMEWSATGRIGASLAALAGGRFAAFSSARCASRLHEMLRPEWAARSGVVSRNTLKGLAEALAMHD